MLIAPKPPTLPRLLGFAGLLPQIAAVVGVASASPRWHFAGFILGYAYSAIILSFLGGMWWGLAAANASRVRAWVWVAAVVPSLIALATAIPWLFGFSWPGVALAAIGVSLIVSLLVDRQLLADGVAPSWWLSLRIPLSVGLGGLTIAAAAMV